MEYISVAKMAEKWGLSERSVRNYCAHGRIADAKLIGKTWYIPENAQKPDRANKKNNAPTLDIKEYNYLKGLGAIGKYENKTYYIGNLKLLKQNNIEISDEILNDLTNEYNGKTIIYFASDKLESVFIIADKVKLFD